MHNLYLIERVECKKVPKFTIDDLLKNGNIVFSEQFQKEILLGLWDKNFFTRAPFIIDKYMLETSLSLYKLPEVIKKNMLMPVHIFLPKVKELIEKQKLDQSGHINFFKVKNLQDKKYSVYITYHEGFFLFDSDKYAQEEPLGDGSLIFPKKCRSRA